MRAAFLRSPLVELSAFAALHFLELLAGPKAGGLHVKDAAKLGALVHRPSSAGWLGSIRVKLAVSMPRSTTYAQSSLEFPRQVYGLGSRFT